MQSVNFSVVRLSGNAIRHRRFKSMIFQRLRSWQRALKYQF